QCRGCVFATCSERRVPPLEVSCERMVLGIANPTPFDLLGHPRGIGLGIGMFSKVLALLSKLAIPAGLLPSRLIDRCSGGCTFLSDARHVTPPSVWLARNGLPDTNLSTCACRHGAPRTNSRNDHTGASERCDRAHWRQKPP